MIYSPPTPCSAHSGCVSSVGSSLTPSYRAALLEKQLTTPCAIIPGGSDVEMNSAHYAPSSLGQDALRKRKKKHQDDWIGYKVPV